MLGSREECLLALKKGHLVSISPGGVREALFSDEGYQLLWGNRKGFAQVALEAKVVSVARYQPQFMVLRTCFVTKCSLGALVAQSSTQKGRLERKDFFPFSHHFPQAHSSAGSGVLWNLIAFS